MADAWLDGLTQFHAQRERSIGGEDGWITLVALDWIAPGDNVLGSGGRAQLKLPADRAPAVVGTLTRTGEAVHAKIASGVRVTANGAPFVEGDLADDHDGAPTVLTLGTLTMRVIKRGDRLALRVKDTDAPARRAFKGLSFFPPDPALHVKAKLVATPGKTLKIANVLGQNEDMPSPGTLHFTIAGKPYTLDAVKEQGDDQLFVLFRDASAGHGTYPSGRFLYVPLPSANVSLTVSLCPAKSIVRCQEATAGSPAYAGVRSATACTAPPLPGVTVIVDVVPSRCGTIWPAFSKRSTLLVSVPCWMPLWVQIFSVTASQSLSNKVKAP